MSYSTFILYLGIFLKIGYSTGSSENSYFIYDAGNNDWPSIPLDGNIPDHLWKKGGEVKVLVHGLNSNTDRTPFEVITAHHIFILGREYSKYNNNLNIIVVDWTSLATTKAKDYPKVVGNVKPAGKQIAEYLIKLKENGLFADWSMVHILGNSLGAHTSAVVGNEIQNLQGGRKVGRITGLDPAGALFTELNGHWPRDMSKVLDHTDADFVDIIHTNVGVANSVWWYNGIVNGEFGSDLASGHLDFFPNGGSHMEYQCNLMDDRLKLCSHQIAVLYFALALREPNSYIGCPCDSWTHLLWGLCRCNYPGQGELFGDKARKHDTRKQFMLAITKKFDASYFS